MQVRIQKCHLLRARILGARGHHRFHIPAQERVDLCNRADLIEVLLEVCVGAHVATLGRGEVARDAPKSKEPCPLANPQFTATRIGATTISAAMRTIKLHTTKKKKRSTGSVFACRSRTLRVVGVLAR